jgi:hypothetical protein
MRHPHNAEERTGGLKRCIGCLSGYGNGGLLRPVPGEMDVVRAAGQGAGRVQHGEIIIDRIHDCRRDSHHVEVGIKAHEGAVHHAITVFAVSIPIL